MNHFVDYIWLFLLKGLLLLPQIHFLKASKHPFDFSKNLSTIDFLDHATERKKEFLSAQHGLIKYHRNIRKKCIPLIYTLRNVIYHINRFLNKEEYGFFTCPGSFNHLFLKAFVVKAFKPLKLSIALEITGLYSFSSIDPFHKIVSMRFQSIKSPRKFTYFVERKGFKKTLNEISEVLTEDHLSGRVYKSVNNLYKEVKRLFLTFPVVTSIDSKISTVHCCENDGISRSYTKSHHVQVARRMYFHGWILCPCMFAGMLVGYFCFKDRPQSVCLVQKS